jgi:hypothetical protein
MIHQGKEPFVYQKYAKVKSNWDIKVMAQKLQQKGRCLIPLLRKMTITSPPMNRDKENVLPL